MVDGRALETFPNAGLQALRLNKPNPRLAADALVLREQVFVNPRAAVALFTGVERGPHEDREGPIPLRARRLWPLAPRVEPARRHAQPLTELVDRVVRLLRLDPRKLHRWSFAKKAVAFFSTSRSRRSSRTSFRKRPSSSRSLLVRTPGLPLPRSVRACSTQLRSDDSVRSRSRAAAPTDLPSSKTKRTAPALNSSVKLRRARFGFRSAMVDIVSTSRKMSTKPDQAQGQPNDDCNVDQANGDADGRSVHTEHDMRLRVLC